jgi:hypothetical protein
MNESINQSTNRFQTNSYKCSIITLVSLFSILSVVLYCIVYNILL